MKSHALFLALLMGSHAYATNTPDPDPLPSPQAFAVGVGVGVAHSDASATGGAATATQTQSAEAHSEGSQASSDNSVAITSTYRGVRNAPSVALGGVFPTADCQGGFGLGGSGINGSGLLNFSFSKKECQLVVLAQNFAALGMPDVSCEILKTTKAWQNAVKRNPNLAAVCETPEVVSHSSDAAASVPAVDMSSYATKEELNRAFEKAVSK